MKREVTSRAQSIIQWAHVLLPGVAVIGCLIGILCFSAVIFKDDGRYSARSLTRVEDLHASGFLTSDGTTTLGDATHDTSTGRDLTVGRNAAVTGTLTQSAGQRVFSVVGTGLTSAASTVSMANTAVVAGSYTSTNLTVDAQGRITAAASGAGGGGTVTSVGCGTGLSCAPSPIVGAGTITLNIVPTACAANSAEITTAADGTSTCAAFVPPARTLTAGTGFTGGGDLSANRTFALANTAVVAGSYTSTNLTVDAQGRITAAASGVGGTSTTTQQQLAISGTYTPTAGTTKVLLEMIGGGGGGGGAAGGAGQASGGGGSSGGYFRKWIAPGVAITGGAYAVGAAGAQGGLGTNGGTGGDTTIVIQGVTYTSKGGAGGQGMASTVSFNNSYGTPTPAGTTVGDINVSSPGAGGLASSAVLLGGIGGGTPLGGGGVGPIGNNPGVNGNGFGAGGGGAQAGATGNFGGFGSIGTIIITEYQQ